MDYAMIVCCSSKYTAVEHQGESDERKQRRQAPAKLGGKRPGSGCSHPLPPRHAYSARQGKQHGPVHQVPGHRHPAAAGTIRLRLEYPRRHGTWPLDWAKLPPPLLPERPLLSGHSRHLSRKRTT